MNKFINSIFICWIFIICCNLQFASKLFQVKAAYLSFEIKQFIYRCIKILTFIFSL